MTSAAEAWERYATQARPRRPFNAAGATTWLNWTQYPDHGPDERVLGDVTGRMVLELGSGRGSNLAHLAMLGAHCTGVDLTPSRTTDARRTWGHLPNIEFITADVADYLSETTTTFHAVYSIFGAVWFTAPETLFPLVRSRMTPGGIFAFSHLPATSVTGSAAQTVRKWEYPADQWVELLTKAGFAAASAEIIPGPSHDDSGTLLVHAIAGS